MQQGSSLQGKVQHIALVMAMMDEALPVIDSLGLKPLTGYFDPLPMTLYQGQWRGLTISLVHSGKDSRFSVDHIGPVPASVSATLCCQKLAPDVMISAGTAGGFAAKGAIIGRVYLSHEHCVFHDRHVPLSGFQQSGIGFYPVLDVSKMAAALGLPQGIVSTGSSLKKSADDIRVITEQGAVAKEMEAAAVAWVCQHFGMAFFALKSITNLLDEHDASEEHFEKNLAYASERLQEVLMKVLDYCQQHSIEQL